MIETLESIDRQLLLLINGCNSPFFDELMWIISGKLTWIPLYALLLFFMIRKAPRQWWVLIIGIAAAITLADSISVHCFKNVVMRYRPTHNLDIENIVHLVHGYRGGWYGFVSSHAANTFAIAVFVAMILKNRWATIGIFVWAAVVCYSRIYMAAHYPADIACGAILGGVCGYAAYRLHQFICSKLPTPKTENQQDGRA